MRRILLLRFSSLGDLVLLSVLLEELRRQEPEARIWLVTKPEYAPLYRRDPRVHELITLPPGRGGLARLRWRLQKIDFDLVLDAHGSLRSRLLSFGLSHAPLRRIAKDSFDRLLFLRARVALPRLARTQVDRYLDLVDAEGRPVRPCIVLDEGDETRADEVCPRDRGPILGLAPGARHATKQWPLDRYAEVTRRFLASHEGEVVLVGSPSERELCERLASDFPSRVRVAAGRVDLKATAALLRRARLFVGNDSGLMHLAEAVGTPVVGIFGPTSRELGYFPLDPRSRVLENTLPCRPCSRNGARPCHLSETLCITLTTVERVHREIEEAWT